MSWFGSSSNVELDNLISEATSESIPNGSVEISVAYDITDKIRSKQIPPQQAMRALKKRLTMVYMNPNLVRSTLQLIDICVKNSGYHFLVEISSKEFMDYLAHNLLSTHYNVRDRDVRRNPARLEVGESILRLIKEWQVAFEGQMQLGYVDKVYRELVAQGFAFPTIESSTINTKFVDSEVAPDWVDSDQCMYCYNKFSIVNRKHHCRACGGVFCQQHSSNNIPLVSLGINDPVRVCDNCYAKQRNRGGRGSISGAPSTRAAEFDAPSGPPPPDDEDEQLRQAIALSLQDQGPAAQAQSSRPSQPSQPAPVAASSTTAAAPSSDAPEEDEELKAALAASLAEYEQEKSRRQGPSATPNYGSAPSEPPVEEPPQSTFYNIDIPQFPAPQAPQAPPSFSQQPPPPSQPPQNPYAQYNRASQLPGPQGSALAPQPPRPKLDLTQQDEENINLFITMMTNIKSDDRKRANIMYDSNLNELHGRVTTLKPKVNRSLRDSIEKYDSFVELNNKISSAMKMYDEFLEAKLNMAYGNHTISSTGYTGYGQPQATGPPNYTGNPSSAYGQPPPPPQPSQPEEDRSYIPAQLTGGFSQARPLEPPQPQPSQPPQEPLQPQHTFNQRPQAPPAQAAPPSSVPPPQPAPPSTQPSAVSPYPTGPGNDGQPRHRSSMSEPSYYPQTEHLPTDDDMGVSSSMPPPQPGMTKQTTAEFMMDTDASKRFPALDQEDIDAINSSIPQKPTGTFSKMSAFPEVPEDVGDGSQEFSNVAKFPELVPVNTGGSRHTQGSRYEPEALIDL